MPYAITQLCCTDASCVAACPVNCIHPTPDEPDFGTTDMLYVDPRTCIDCGACAEACPVDAVLPVETLTGALADYPAINAEYFAGTEPAAPAAGSPLFHDWGPVRFDRVLPADFPRLDVAVVGSGPAGMYTVQDLLLHTTARVTLYDRLPVTGGLVNFGVAPDHADTKRIGESFARYLDHHRLRLRLGIEVGRDVGVDELAARHDAVIYAVGAPTSRALGVPGEELAGHLPSTTVVGWYNGHPEIDADAVVVGVGIIPNTDLAEAAGLEVADGVVVDARHRTSDPDVHAAGDVARLWYPAFDRHLRVEHWDNALNGGPAAARAMLGDETPYDHLPYFFTDQYDLGMEYTGYVAPGEYDEVVVRGELGSREFVAFWLARGRVLAGMNVNIWDVTDPIARLVRHEEGFDRPRHADPAVPLA